MSRVIPDGTGASGPAPVLTAAASLLVAAALAVVAGAITPVAPWWA